MEPRAAGTLLALALLTAAEARAGPSSGYVDDAVCASCHDSIARSYREVGMSRSFSRPRRETPVEGLVVAPFTHTASHRTYAIFWRGKRLVFRRWQTDDDGDERNVLEQDVDWILGSGNHARTYLYRTPSGELFQLPVAWYAETRALAMAPGYDRPDHEEVGRRVRRECMFCHNAYPETLTGDERGDPQVFPASLPEGTGCQRCHGPGGEHVTLALRGAADAEVRAAVVNPAKLPPERRNDVCFQCHLQPSVAIPGTRRLGRSDYSFRPGQALGDYLVPMDIDAGPAPAEGRFEINHHPYRLLASRCAQKSGARLSCLTCHDPHRKVPPAERAAHYRAACLGCHGADDLRARHEESSRGIPFRSHDSDCVACHMPPRRPQDVVHTRMTDHRIGIYLDLAALVAPLAESEPRVDDVRLYGLAPAPAGAGGDLYRALAAVSASGSAEALGALQRLGAGLPSFAREVDTTLIPALLRRGDDGAAEPAIARLLQVRPDDPLALDWLSVVRARQGRRDEAVAILRRLSARGALPAESAVNLGRLLLARGEDVPAREAFGEAARLRPNLLPAWLGLAQAARKLRDPIAEIAALRQGLVVDPGEARLYRELVAALTAERRFDDAQALLRFAKTVARDPEALGAPAEP